jgi:hypothetical protein
VPRMCHLAMAVTLTGGGESGGVESRTLCRC